MFGTTDTSGDDVRVVGPTNLSSVDCESFSAAGATNVEGDVTATDVSLKGTASVGGDVSAAEFVAKGATEVGGSLTADEATVKGSTSVDSVTADRLEAKGASEFGDVSVDSASTTGSLSVADLVADDSAEISGVASADSIRADEVRIVLADGESTVEDIVGGTVSVERETLGKGWGIDGASTDGHLRAKTVEGDAVVVEHATVEKIVGEQVHLGPGARVEVVRAGELEVHEDATVERTKNLR